MRRICYRFNRYIHRRWKAKSSRRSILRASSSKWLWYDSKHSTTNLMYRTAKGISPCSWCCNGAPPTCRFSLLHHLPHASRISPRCFPTVLSLDFPYFFRSLNHRNALKTDTILIIKAGCDSRTLWQTNFDGKSMPCLSSECRYLRFPWMPHALFAFILLLFFLLMENFERW